MDLPYPTLMAPPLSSTQRRSGDVVGSARQAVGRFEQIVAEEKDRVYSFAYYYLGNAVEAEDVVQESMIKLWQNLGEIEGACGGWLHRVVRNACFDRLRRRRTARRVLAEGADTAHVPDSAPEPGDAAERRDLQGHVRRLVAELPEPYRSAIVLREIQELKYREIGEMLDLPVNTVKTHVHRGRQMLRQSLGGTVLAEAGPAGLGEGAGTLESAG